MLTELTKLVGLVVECWRRCGGGGGGSGGGGGGGGGWCLNPF